MPRKESGVDAETKKIVNAVLSKAEKDYDVKILFACESGSRAWGFASPDSDYDIRFVYCHKSHWYFSLTEKRDVIELGVNHIDKHEIDASGWDLRKSLRLLKNSHPVLIEWLSSPIVYRKDEQFFSDLKEISGRFYRLKSSYHHYLSMAKKHLVRHLDKEEVGYKKYFYALRPIFACHWILGFPKEVPPFEFEALMRSSVLDSEVQQEVLKLLELKSSTPEKLVGKRIEILHEYIVSQIAVLESRIPELPQTERVNVLEHQLDAFFRESVLGSALGNT